MHIFDLPFDLLAIIVKYLTLNEALTFGETCKKGDRMKYEKTDLKRLTIRHQNMMKFYQVQKSLQKLTVLNCINVDWYLLSTLPKVVELRNCTFYEELEDTTNVYTGVKKLILKCRNIPYFMVGGERWVSIFPNIKNIIILI